LVETLVKSPTSERLINGSFGTERVVQMGQLAIRSEQLGINDPLTHLYQYIERGDEALVGIKEDIETDIAERLPNTPFINQVGFEFTGDDFVSVKDRVSMKLMTENNLQILASEQMRNSDLSNELARAEVEAMEVDKLSTWFMVAKPGDFLIFESLPIGKQKVAISRIYQKLNEDCLDSSFVSLYEPSVELFNNLRKNLGLGKSDCQSELDVLGNEYAVHNHEPKSMEQFIDTYVETYDGILSEREGEKHRFGLNNETNTGIDEGISKVRKQPRLTEVYIDAIKSLADGRGKVSSDILRINEKLGLGFKFRQGDAISVKVARDVLSEIIRGVASAIDRADVDLLFDINQPDSSSGMSYAVVSHYGSEARSEGVSYESNACPEFSSTNPFGVAGEANKSEFDSMLGAFNPMDIPNKFGRPKIGVCRINNCPTRGESKYVHNKTLVGGCDICVHCHKIFEKGKSPEKIYDEKLKEDKKKQKKAEEERTRLEQQKVELEKQKTSKQKQMLMKRINIRKKTKQKSFFQEIVETEKSRLLSSDN